MTPPRPFALLAPALVLSVLSLNAPALHAQDSGAPLSAIGWLDQALAAPVPGPPPPETRDIPPRPDLAPPAFDSEPIATTPLDASGIDSTGLFTAERIGLPRSLWGAAPLPEILSAIASLPDDTMPTANRLALRLLMAEFAPPWQLAAEDQGKLLLARVDALIGLGALEQAGQLIEATPERTSALSARAFDIALLLGEEDRACDQMSGRIATTYGHGAQIFCTARRGNWQAAHSALNVARSLGLIDRDESTLLLRFLEEEEDEFLLPPPQRITPLIWRIMEALGDPVTTATLPVAFAHADLRGTSGWRAQLDAAERLTRAGVMQPNRLLGLYTQRRAAASGGLWERVRIIQALDQAIAADDMARVSAALVQAWSLFAAVELEQALAEMTAETLASLPLTGEGAEALWKLLLLSQEHAERAAELAPETSLGRFIMTLAQGDDLPSSTAHDMANAIALAFEGADLPDTAQSQISAGMPGLVLLDGLRQIADAAAGDLQAATRGLQRLRALGLEQTARQVGIELLLLERRG